MKNNTIVIDVPMLEARGVKRMLKRAIDVSEGNLAYRETTIPLRRHYTIRGDHRLIAVLRRYFINRGITPTEGL